MPSKNNAYSKFDCTLPMASLCVADFMTQDLPPKVKPKFQGWKDKKLNSRIAIAEACSRNIYYGALCEFDDLEPLQPSTEFHHGVDAYKFLMIFILGFANSEGAYDPAAKSRFMEGWSKLAKRNPDTEKIYRPILSGLALDSHLVEKQMPSKVKPQRPWLIARELSQQQKGDSVLIIGEETDGGLHLSDLTKKIATTVNGKGLLTPSGIGYCHPNEQSADNIGKKLNTLYRKHGLSADFYNAQFTELELAFEIHDRIFITMEMGAEPDAERRIIDAWKNRSRTDNTLVHLKRANCHNRDAETLWNKAKLDNYTSPTDIIAIAQERSQIFASIKESVFDAVELMASMRLYGQQPFMDNIKHLFQNVDKTRSLKAA